MSRQRSRTWRRETNQKAEAGHRTNRSLVFWKARKAALMGEPGTGIGQILAEAYRLIGRNRAPVASEPLLAEVTRIIGIYSEGMRVRPLEVISTGACGMVRTKETATNGGASKTWHGVHRWCFKSGRCTKFEVYGQTTGRRAAGGSSTP